jgi:hypothetical protein
MMIGAAAGSPSTIATPTVPSSSALKPARCALCGLTLKTTAGPLVVFSMPSSTSTTGIRPRSVIFPTASAT